MSWDKTKIVNLALIKIGDDRLSNADTTDTKPAKVMREIYDNTRDALLQSYPWNFAIELASLAVSGTAPEWGFINKFPLPTNLLALLAIKDIVTTRIITGESGQETPYQVIGKFIHTNLAAPLEIRYIKQITDEAQFTPLFGEAFAAKLAVDSGESITQSNTKNAWLLAGFDRTISRAFSADAIENPADPLPEDEWINARF